MQIIPKIDTNNCRNLTEELSWLENYEGAEIQLLSDDFVNETATVSNLIERFPKMKYFCFHAPFSHVCLGYLLASTHYRLQLMVYLKFLVVLASKYDLRIDFLCHIQMPANEFRGLRCAEWLKEIDQSLTGSNVRIILENSIAPLNYPLMADDTIANLFETEELSNVVACIDVCHLHASEAVWGETIRLSERYAAKVENIHFAYTNATEGVPYKLFTHSSPHPDSFVAGCDLVYLAGKGIDLNGVRFVAEVRETDYSKRENLKKQLSVIEDALRVKTGGEDDVG